MEFSSVSFANMTPYANALFSGHWVMCCLHTLDAMSFVWTSRTIIVKDVSLDGRCSRSSSLLPGVALPKLIGGSFLTFRSQFCRVLHSQTVSIGRREIHNRLGFELANPRRQGRRLVLLMNGARYFSESRPIGRHITHDSSNSSDGGKNM